MLEVLNIPSYQSLLTFVKSGLKILELTYYHNRGNWRIYPHTRSSFGFLKL